MKKSKKIAFIMPNTLPMPAIKGGAVENILQNYLELNEKSENPQNITIFCKFDIDAKKEAQKYKYTQYIYIEHKGNINYIKKIILGLLNKVFRYNIGNLYIREIFRHLKNQKFDYIIIENAPYYLPIIKKINSIKIMHIHNDYSEEMKKIVNNYSSKTICVSNYIKETYKTYQIYNASAVLYNCIDILKFKFDKNFRKEIRDKFSLKEKDILFIYTGRLIKGKGILEMVQAFILASKIKKNLKLMIVGGISFSNNKIDNFLKKCIKEIKDNENIILTGYIDYNVLAKYYSAADIGVIPSLLKEAASLSAIEMISTGLPLIANKIAGLEEMAKYGDVYFIDSKNNYIENLKNLMLTVERKVRKQNSYNLDNFSIEKYKSNLENILDNKGESDV